MAYLLPQLLSRSAARDPAREAVAFKDELLTYGELEQASNRLAHVLIAAGVGRGDRVGIYLAKSPVSLISIYGILKTGAARRTLDRLGTGARRRVRRRRHAHGRRYRPGIHPVHLRLHRRAKRGNALAPERADLRGLGERALRRPAGGPPLEPRAASLRFVHL